MWLDLRLGSGQVESSDYEVKQLRVLQISMKWWLVREEMKLSRRDRVQKSKNLSDGRMGAGQGEGGLKFLKGED